MQGHILFSRYVSVSWYTSFVHTGITRQISDGLLPFKWIFIEIFLKIQGPVKMNPADFIELHHEVDIFVFSEMSWQL